jgi:hypothetical protein
VASRKGKARGRRWEECDRGAEERERMDEKEESEWNNEEGEACGS